MKKVPRTNLLALSQEEHRRLEGARAELRRFRLSASLPHVRCDPQLRQRVEQAAEALRRRPSDFIRLALEKECDRVLGGRPKKAEPAKEGAT